MTKKITYRVPIVRLVGVWRFLTPMEKLQENDYGRIRLKFGSHTEDWMPVHMVRSWYSVYQEDKRAIDLPNVELVRGVPNESEVVTDFINVVRLEKDSELEAHIECLQHVIREIAE